MAPKRFGEKVTYQGIRKLSEDCHLLHSGAEQDLSRTEKSTEEAMKKKIR